MHKAIEHLIRPIYASPVAIGRTGAHNVADVGAPSSNPDQIFTGDRPSTLASPINPTQELVENDGDEELMSDENQLIEVQLFYFSKGETASSSSSSHSVRGRLKSHISFWKCLGASEFILTAIRDGYKIPFLTTPSKFGSKNNRSSIDNCDFVTEAILGLLQDDKISEVNPSDLHNINPLSASIQPCGKKRLILDLIKSD